MSDTNTTPEYLTVRDVAERYRLSESGIRAMVRRGAIPPPIRIGSACRWALEVLRQWEAENTRCLPNDSHTRQL